jgi:beta-glucanase (GH16 family)
LKAESNLNNIKQVNGYLTLNLVENFGGARLSTTEYFQYGEINAVLKVAKGVNVISAFYIEADNGDMVVFNIIQNDKNKNSMIETNFFYQGNMIYDVNAEFFTSNTILYDTFNTYTIIWYPTYYEWRLNNVLLRRLDIQNTLTFPNSPSKVKLSIWEGPVSSWAGPGIDWTQNSTYFSELSSLAITNYCSGNYSRNFSYIEDFNKTSDPTKSLGINNFENNMYLFLVSVKLLFLLLII